MVVVCFRTMLYNFSQNVWDESSVLFDSSRGLKFWTTDGYNNYASPAGRKINKFVHIEMFNTAEKILGNYYWCSL